MAFIGVGAFFILLNTFQYPVLGPIVTLLPIWMGTLILLMTESLLPTPVKDRYHRKHLVSRLADLLVETPLNVRRIGILGEWGDGKSYVLQMLEEELNKRGTEKKFRMARVNPWRASSSDDAWVEIAKGVDRALGFPRLFPQSLLKIPGLGGLLELLPTPFKGLTGDIKTLLSSEGSHAKRVALGLGEFLESRKQWLLIFVDDMERVGPDEIRKLFPVVDRLIDLERCYFIFAIDPKRIAKAFEENGGTTEETKGYLDKVLDFQITLPPASQDDILAVLAQDTNEENCPKLSKVLTSLREFLPTNPRLASRFLREAEGRERMFLSRFGPNEQNYEGFFLLLLLEIRFPAVFNKLRQERSYLEEFKFLVRKGFFSGGNGENTEMDELVEKLTTDSSPTEKLDVLPFIKRLSHLVAALLIFDEGVPSLDLKWAFEGYRKLIQFSVDEQEEFMAIWAKEAGSSSIESMLQRVGKFSEPHIVARQAFESDFEVIGSLFDTAYRLLSNNQPLDILKTELSVRLKRLSDHAGAIKTGQMKPLDHAVFDQAMFDAWVKIAESKLMIGLPDDFVAEIRTVRHAVTHTLLELIEPKERYKWCQQGVWSIINSSGTKLKDALESEFLPVRDKICSEFTNAFVDLMEKEDLREFFPPPWLNQNKLFSLIDPTIWLLGSEDVAKSTMDYLIGRSARNANLHQNFITLISEALLAIYDSSPDDALLATSAARPSIEKYPWYLEKCWEGAWKIQTSEKPRCKIIELRDKAISIERGLAEGRNAKSTILGILEKLDVPEEPSTQHSNPFKSA